MEFPYPSVIIENGSSRTRAGYSNEDYPSVIFSSNYAQNSKTGKTFIGDDIFLKNLDFNYENLEIYTLSDDNGLIYNWDHLAQNWEYIYRNLNIEDSKDYPLIITEQVWNSFKNKKKYCQLAFEQFEVPIFSIFKKPLCNLFGLGKSTGLIIDIGSSITNINPILDGTILFKGSVHSKIAGNYIDLHILNYLKKNHYHNDLGSIVPKNLIGLPSNKYTESFKNTLITNDLIFNFKKLILSANLDKISNKLNLKQNFNKPKKNYMLPDNRIIEINEEQVELVEPLFHPKPYTNSILSYLSNDNSDSLRNIEVAKEIYQQLLKNIVVVGGSSLIENMEERIKNELRLTLSNFEIETYSPQDTIERENSSWIGASILASMNNFDSFISKQEYEELGEDLIVERFK
ncbi:Actin/actin-like protein [Ascoidea rubescens DSM 1968]|uniref:Actin/actin-like protein n=1 Tax=Ascoidea rubescens DSM 1968 TaxID=1344418 RepID=A0A1D2VQK0_9ASCO|nr:Actin/actin-like protein [Ascoidea rubescens DSM 1968]ODV63858.1 Actin/actin-like protein [Ascoidea rubescens DSM 1968]